MMFSSDLFLPGGSASSAFDLQTDSSSSSSLGGMTTFTGGLPPLSERVAEFARYRDMNLQIRRRSAIETDERHRVRSERIPRAFGRSIGRDRIPDAVAAVDPVQVMMNEWASRNDSDNDSVYGDENVDENGSQTGNQNIAGPTHEDVLEAIEDARQQDQVAEQQQVFNWDGREMTQEQVLEEAEREMVIVRAPSAVDSTVARMSHEDLVPLEATANQFYDAVRDLQQPRPGDRAVDDVQDRQYAYLSQFSPLEHLIRSFFFEHVLLPTPNAWLAPLPGEDNTEDLRSTVQHYLRHRQMAVNYIVGGFSLQQSMDVAYFGPTHDMNAQQLVVLAAQDA